MVAIDRTQEMAALASEARQRGAQVTGEGNLAASLMLVGEAPGRVEVATGRPFVGPAGEVLNRVLDRLSIPRSDLWITNAVKIRPTVDNRNRVNRPPTTSEVATYHDLLLREITIVKPRVIVCLGGVAASTLIHHDFRVRQERGLWFPGPGSSCLLATYHPSYLLHLRGSDFEKARDEMLADLALAWSQAQSSAACCPSGKSDNLSV